MYRWSPGRLSVSRYTYVCHPYRAKHSVKYLIVLPWPLAAWQEFETCDGRIENFKWSPVYRWSLLNKRWRHWNAGKKNELHNFLINVPFWPQLSTRGGGEIRIAVKNCSHPKRVPTIFRIKMWHSNIASNCACISFKPELTHHSSTFSFFSSISVATAILS